MQLKIPSDEQLQAIYRDMHKVEEKTSGIARLCYNSCYYMAVAIFNGLNKVQNCHLYQENSCILSNRP